MPKKAVGKTVSKVEGQFLKICATRDWSRNLKFFSSLTPDEQICIQKVVIHKVMYSELRAEDMVKIVELMKTRASQEEEDWDTCYGTVLIRRAKHILAYGGGPEGGFVMINSEWYSLNREWAELATYKKLKDQKLIWRHLNDEDENSTQGVS